MGLINCQEVHNLVLIIERWQTRAKAKLYNIIPPDRRCFSKAVGPSLVIVVTRHITDELPTLGHLKTLE